MSSEG